MKYTLLGSLLGLLAACGAADGDSCPVLGQVPAGGLVITEIMADPNALLGSGEAVSDTDGEWVELLNTLPYSLNPTGLQLASGKSVGRLVCAEKVAPGRLFLAARNADPLANGGLPKVHCTYDKLSLLNSASSSIPEDATSAARLNHLQVLTASGAVIDDVPYLVGGAGFPKVKKGASLQLCRNALSAEYNDDGAWWYLSTGSDAQASGDLGTPSGLASDCGAPDSDGSVLADTQEPEDSSLPLPPNPVAGEIFISEFMADPKLVDDAQGEWFELYYCGDAEVTLKGLHYEIGTTTKQITQDLRMLPGYYLVFAKSNAATPAGDPPDALFTGTLANSGDKWIRILDAQKGLLHEVGYGEVSSVGGKVTAGASNHLCISDQAFCPGVTQVWEVSTTVFGDGDKGTPGFMNETCGGGN